jgi:hypothetical protein
MLSVEDWAEIRRPHRAEGLPIKVIARVLGISKNTVKAALASDAPPKYQRAQRGSIVEEVEPRIRELLRPIPGCRPLGGVPRCGVRAITTCAATPTTTLWTPPLSDTGYWRVRRSGSGPSLL